MTLGFWTTQYFTSSIVRGDLIYLLGALFGLAALTAQFETLFSVIRWLGAAYLIYLGFRAWTTSPVDPGSVRREPGDILTQVPGRLWSVLVLPSRHVINFRKYS